MLEADSVDQARQYRAHISQLMEQLHYAQKLLNTRIKGCIAGQDSLPTTRIIHALLLKHYSLSHHPFYATNLVRLYALNGELICARKLFDENPNPTIYLSNSIIRAYARVHKFTQALTLFNHLPRPDNYTFACISRACPDATTLQIMHGKLLTHGFGFDLVCNTSLLTSYANLGLLHQATRVFCTIPNPDLVLCNTIISASRHSFYFRLMQTRGIRPDGYTIVGLLTGLDHRKSPKQGETIHAFCIKSSLDSNHHVTSALLACYSRCNCMDLSCKLFNSLVQPDLVSWSALIAGFTQAGDHRKALHFFRLLLMSDGRPDSVLLASALAASAQLAIMGPGIEIHAYAIRHNIIADVAVSSALIDMYAKCGFLEMGIHVFKVMPVRNIVTYNSVIYGLGLYGRAIEAIQLFREILEMRLKPDETTFSGVLCACCHAGLVKDGRECFRRMKEEFGIRAKTEHYIYMVKLLGINGYLEEAFSLVKSLTEPVDSSIWGALLTCCESQRNYELHNVIAEHLLENKSSDSRYRIMFSNMFAGDGRWDDVEQMRVDVIGGATLKMPGISRAVM